MNTMDLAMIMDSVCIKSKYTANRRWNNKKFICLVSEILEEKSKCSPCRKYILNGVRFKQTLTVHNIQNKHVKVLKYLGRTNVRRSDTVQRWLKRQEEHKR